MSTIEFSLLVQVPATIVHPHMVSENWLIKENLHTIQLNVNQRRVSTLPETFLTLLDNLGGCNYGTIKDGIREPPLRAPKRFTTNPRE